MGDVIQTILSPKGGPVAFPGSAPESPACSMAPRSWGLGCSQKIRGPSIKKADQTPHRKKGNPGSADQGHLMWC